MNVELIYDADCPNVAPARSALIKAFAQTGVSARWKEWERGSQDSPPHVHEFGSPTILVDGEDVAGPGSLPSPRSCRLYLGSDGRSQPIPPLELIRAALLKNARAINNGVTDRGRWRSIAASFPAIGTALLPKLVCPLCWTAYTAALSALGLEFFNYTPYLLPVTLIFLGIALGALTIHAKRTDQRTGLVIGIAGAAIVLLGKFAFELDWLNTVGIGFLAVAIFVSLRRRKVEVAACPACVGVESTAKVETY